MAEAIGFIATPIFQRLRPFNSGISEYVEGWQFVCAMEAGKFSFPSGHTASAVAAMLALVLPAER